MANVSYHVCYNHDTVSLWVSWFVRPWVTTVTICTHVGACTRVTLVFTWGAQSIEMRTFVTLVNVAIWYRADTWAPILRAIPQYHCDTNVTYVTSVCDVPINDLPRATGEYCTCASYIRNFPDTPLRCFAATRPNIRGAYALQDWRALKLLRLIHYNKYDYKVDDWFPW